jgi:hypothetical protein
MCTSFIPSVILIRCLIMLCWLVLQQVLAARKVSNTIVPTSDFAILYNLAQLTCDAQIHLWHMLYRLGRLFWEVKKLEYGFFF